MSLSAVARWQARPSSLLVGSLLVAAVFWVRLAHAEIGFELHLKDFVQYWAAARLTLSGENPYDPAAMAHLEQQAGRADDVLLMFNPPWVLPVVLPFGLLDHRLAYLAWMALQVGVLAASAVLLWRYYGGPREQTGAALLIAFTFVPTFLALLLAQISPLLLFGAVLFLVLERRGQFFFAGAAATLMTIKPHLTYLFWVAFVLWSIERRRWPALAGAALTGLVAGLLPLLWDLHIWTHYRDFFLHHPPAQYSSPTLGTVLRLLFDPDNFRLQYLALLPGFVWLAVFYRRRRAAWDWGREMPWLLLVSLLTAAYGAWPFDLVLLLVPVIQVGARAAGRERPLAGFHVAFNGVAGCMVAGLVHFFWFLWMTPVLLTAYCRAAGKCPLPGEALHRSANDTCSPAPATS